MFTRTRSFVLFLFYYANFLHKSHQLCEPCPEDTKCPVLDCPGSEVPGVCGCCSRCAKQVGEKCGGKFSVSGVCESGLKCVKLELGPGLGGVVLKKNADSAGTCINTGNFANCREVCAQTDALIIEKVGFSNRGRSTYFDSFPSSNKWIYCDCSGGQTNEGWMVIQRRIFNIEKFARSMWVYQQGFGTSKSDFWLGLDSIHGITSKTNHELRVTIKLDNGEIKKTYFSKFSVDGLHKKYKLNIKPTSDDTSRNFAKIHNGMYFSAPDRDNDNWSAGHCARYLRSGWWFNQCSDFNLHGVLYGVDPFDMPFGPADGSSNGPDKVTWEACNMKTIIATEMAIRPLP